MSEDDHIVIEGRNSFLIPTTKYFFFDVFKFLFQVPEYKPPNTTGWRPNVDILIISGSSKNPKPINNNTFKKTNIFMAICF